MDPSKPPSSALRPGLGRIRLNRPDPRHAGRGWTRVLPIVLALAAGLISLGAAPSASPTPTTSPSGAQGLPVAGAPAAPPPVLAYFYMWFTPSSWQHAKSDLPALGPYSSTDPAIIKQQVAWAKQAGVDAFIVSWKSTPSLNLALSELVAECRLQGLKLVLIYEGLDVNRNPIPVGTVQADLLWFENQYGSDPVFNVYGKPAIVWSGSWRFSNTDISTVRSLIDAPNRVLLLGSEKSAALYQPRASLLDGDAYYWSSADPLTTPGYQKRLSDLAAAVHRGKGLWLAPAAVGFDARLNGGTTAVDRRNGATLTSAWNDALATNPDGVAIISWNEYTENSYIEPSRDLGNRYLTVLSILTGGPGPSHSPATGIPPSGGTASPGSSPAQSSPSAAVGAGGGGSVPGRLPPSDWIASLLVAATLLGLLGLLGYKLRSRSRRALGGADPADPPDSNGQSDSLGRPLG